MRQGPTPDVGNGYRAMGAIPPSVPGKLSDRAELNKILLDTVEALICVMDERGHFVLFNRVCEECTGFRFEDLQGRPVWETLIPLSEREGVRRVFDDLRQHQLPSHYVNHWLTQDGGRRLIEWSNSILSDPVDDTVLVIGTGIDITDRHEAELQARRRMELLTLTATIGDVLARPVPLDERLHRVVEVVQAELDAPLVSIWLYNDAHSTLRQAAWAGDGQEVDELSGSLSPESPVAEIASLQSPRCLHGAEQIGKLVGMGRALRSDIQSFAGYPMVADDAALGVIGLFSQAPLTTEERDVIGLVADQLTLAVQRHRSDEALLDSESRFRSTFEHAPVGIAHIATDGRFLRVNRRFGEIVGYSIEELLKHSFRDLTHPDDLPIDDEIARRLLAGDLASHAREKRYIHKNGGTVWADLSVSVFRSSGGGPKYFITAVADITERKKAQEALGDSEARLQAVFRVAPTGVAVVHKRAFLQVNDRICEMTGYDMEELIGRNTRFLYPTEEEYRSASAENRRQIAIRGTGSTETRWKRKDGDIIDILLSGTPLDPSDFQVGVSLTVMDITERKRAEQALRESEEKYRSVVERANDGIVIIQDNILRYVNPRMAEIVGYRAEEIIGTSYAEHICDEYRDATLERYGERLRGASLSQVYESAVLHKDGRRINVEINGGLISYEGAPADLVFLRDVSERTEAQREMNQLRNLLQNTIDSMPSVLVCVDGAGRIIQWNEEATRFTGTPAIRALGTTIEKAFVFLQPERERVAEAIRENAVHTMSRVPWEVGGKVRDFDVTIYPLRSGETNGAVLRIDDVSERVKIEEMMVQTEKMITVGGLAAGMAHEINNPLAGMVQNANVIMNRMKPGHPTNERLAAECGTSIEQISAYVDRRKIMPLLESMRASGEKAARIIRNMLSFSRESNTAPRPQNITTLVDRALELACNDIDLKKSYGFKSLSIVREYADELPLVPCHDTEIEQVLLNLFRNAAQALRERTDPEFEPKIAVRVLSERRTVRIEVEDNGAGMSESVRRRVFEPFFTTKPPGVGTGLGLSVSYFIVVDHHGGTISVSSRPGKGATFALRLPIGR